MGAGSTLRLAEVRAVSPVKRPVAYRDLNVGRLLTSLAEEYPHNEALVYPGSGLRYTFGQLEHSARQTAKGLLSLGIQKGDRVALWAPNIPQWVVLQFALAKIGAILVTVNTSLRAPEIKYILGQSEARALITAEGHQDLNYLEILSSIIPELSGSDQRQAISPALPALRDIIHIGERASNGMINYADLPALGECVSDREFAAREESLDPEDIINMQYTSGTTGFPKGVMLSSRNIVNNAYWIAEQLAITPGDKLCLTVPLFHCFGCVMGVLGAYTHAAAIVLVKRFNPLRVLEVIERERCTVLYGVPTMFIAEMEHLADQSFDLSSLRTGIMAGSPCPESLIRDVIKNLHIPELTVSYGQTEASPGITITPRNDLISRQAKTVGLPLPEMELKVVDPKTGSPCPPGLEGEVCCRGYNVMKGYYKNPEATASAIDEEGWLHTGDQGAIDSDGYLSITGRIKEMIIRGGENIAPREIEDILRQHAKVADAYVYGVQDDKYGEEVAAAIRLKSGQSATPEEIRSFCRNRIARFKIPRYISFMDAFPMTASGKVQRFKLRERHVQSQVLRG